MIRSSTVSSSLVLGLTMFSANVSAEHEFVIFTNFAGQNLSGRMLIVRNPLGDGEACGIQGSVHNVAIVDGNWYGPAVLGSAVFPDHVAAGDRFRIDSLEDCGGGNAALGLTEVSPSQASFANRFAGADAELQDDDILVATEVIDSFTDEVGTYSIIDALLVGSGKPSVVTVGIYEETDTPVRPGDQLDVWLQHEGAYLLVKN